MRCISEIESLTLPAKIMDTQDNGQKLRRSSLRSFGALALAPLMLVACSDGADETANDPDGSMMEVGTGGAASGGAASGGATGTGGATGSGGTPGTGGVLSTGGVSGVGGEQLSTGGDTLATGGESSGTGGDTAIDLTTYAAGLHELFLDRPCEEGVTLPQDVGAVCLHRNPLHVEEEITFGGEPGTTYSVTLRVRGIWEPTNIDGGEVPDSNIPYMVGGDVAPGGGDSAAINYQQFYIEVGSPAQTYWLNEHDYVAHDIHKEDYEITIPIEGGSTVTVVANDGNERQIANFPEEIFDDMPPYDQMPTPGQFLRLDVLGVLAAP